MRMHADLENGNIAENSNGEYIASMDYENSYCNYATIAFINLKLQKKVMMKYLLTH